MKDWTAFLYHQQVLVPYHTEQLSLSSEGSSAMNQFSTGGQLINRRLQEASLLGDKAGSIQLLDSYISYTRM